jgi:peptidyl-prolyl cis-trans isomerase D
MLQSMRERMQGIIAGVIVGIICLTFAFWGIQNYLQSRSGQNVVAKVNGVKITRAQFETAYNRARQIMMLQMGKDFAVDQQTQAKLKDQVLQQLIDSFVLFQAAQELGFRVSQDQVNAVLNQMPIFQVQGHFSVNRFQQVISNMLYSEAGFIADLEQKMMVSQLHMGITGSAFALPDETNNFVKLIKQTRDIGYAIIPASHFADKVTVSQAEIKDYYDQHQQDFTTPEQVSIAYLELTADQLKNQIKTTPAELQQFYDDNIDLYSHPARWQVARIFVPLNTPNAEKKIKVLAKQGKFSKPEWITHGFPNLKPGQISQPIRTDNGFYIVKLLQAKKAETKPFSAVQDQVKKALIQQKTNQLFTEKNNQLSNLTYTNSNTLTVASKQLNLPIKTTDFFTRQGAKQGILANPNVIKAAFSDTVLKQNYNSDLIEIDPGHVIVLRINQHKPSAAKPLTAVQTTIKQQLIEDKSNQQAQQLGAKLLADIQQGKSAQQIVAQQGLTWHTIGQLKRDQKNLDHQIILAAFNLPNQPTTTGINLDKGGYALIQVTKVYPGDIKQLNAEQLKNIKQAMALGFGQADYELLTNEMLKKAKIKKD